MSLSASTALEILELGDGRVSSAIPKGGTEEKEALKDAGREYEGESHNTHSRLSFHPPSTHHIACVVRDKKRPSKGEGAGQLGADYCSFGAPRHMLPLNFVS
jgi:hypothetical protein